MCNELKIKDPEYLEHLRKKQPFALHIHWDGSIPAENLFNLARKRDRKLFLPEKDICGKPICYASEKDRLIDSAEKLKEFQNNLRKYSIIDVFAVPISFMQTKNDLISTAVAHCKYLKSQNIPYAESRFAPQYHIYEGLSLDKVIGYSLECFAKGTEETGVTVKPIVCIGREADINLSKAVVRAALNYEGRVVGIDLACEENGNPPEKHYEAFALTFDSSMKRTIHAGEMCSEEENLKNIYTAITKLRANGLGHAIPLHKRFHKENDLIEMVLDREIRIEANPVSNYILGFTKKFGESRLDELVEEGVLVTLNPDDPAMWPYGDLAHALYFTSKLYGDVFVEKVIENSVKCAWGLTGTEKKEYLKKAKQ